MQKFISSEAPSPQNGQIHSDNSSAISQRIVWVCLTILWGCHWKGQNLIQSLITRKINRFQYGRIIGLNPFHATGLFLYPLRKSKNYRFSVVSRGYGMRPFAYNRLNGLHLLGPQNIFWGIVRVEKLSPNFKCFLNAMDVSVNFVIFLCISTNILMTACHS